MKYILPVLFLSGVAFAQEVPPTSNVDPIPYPDTLVDITSPRAAIVNRESRLANPLYLTELPSPVQVTSKSLVIPEGWQMVEIKHPDEIVCSAYPQPSTWEMVQINPPTIQPLPVTVGRDNVDTITIITEGE